jgi:ATP-binding cassette subfamily F protein 3
MIALHQVYKYYGRHDVLKDASMQVGPGERVGLVGPNGAGKSTILGLMLGEIEPDEGEVFKARSLKIGYLPQDLISLAGRKVIDLAMDTGDRLAEVEAEIEMVHQQLAQDPDPKEAAELIARQGQLQTIFEGLGGYDLRSRAEKTLAGLGFEPGQFEMDVSQLSGGWLMRAALARILLSSPDVIFLDEPTNHLDLESLLWLEGQLVQSPASLVLVSHDRVFLDKVVNRILEIDDGQLYTYGGNYSQYLELRAARRQAQQAAYEAQQDKIKEMERFIERNRSRKDRAKQVQARLKMLDKMERLSAPAAEEVLSFELPPAERSAKVVVELDKVGLAYGEKVVYQDIDFNVQRDDRLALLGKNGEGKTSLLKLLAGLVQPSQGRRLVGGRVKMGVFSQHALEDLNPDNDVLEELSSVAGLLPISRLRSILGVFLFKGDEVFKKVRVLSGGERSRLVLAKLFMSAPNVLLLDEPTNHLDIQGRMVLEKALKKFTGTVVLVSHERHLINAVANKVAHVSGGQINVFPGNYDDFYRLWRKRLTPVDASDSQTAPPQPALSPNDFANSGGSGPKSAAQKRVEAQARNQRYRKLKPLRDELKKLDAKVEKTSAKLDSLVKEMVDPEAFADGERWQKLSRSHDKTKNLLQKLSARWEEVALELEEAEKQEA